MKIVYLFIVVFLAMTFQTVVAWNNKNFKIRSCSSHSDCVTIAKRRGPRLSTLYHIVWLTRKKMAAVCSCFPNFLAMRVGLMAFMSWIFDIWVCWGDLAIWDLYPRYMRFCYFSSKCILWSDKLPTGGTTQGDPKSTCLWFWSSKLLHCLLQCFMLPCGQRCCYWNLIRQNLHIISCTISLMNSMRITKFLV